MAINPLVKELNNKFRQMAGSNLPGYLQKYRVQLQEILKDLLSYNRLDYSYNTRKGTSQWLSSVAQEEAAKWIDNTDSSTRNTIMKAQYRFNQNRKNLYEDIYDQKYTKAMYKAYRLMNEIGEELRGKKIQYTVVIASKSKGKEIREQWDGLNIDEFLDLTTIHRTTSPNSLHRYGRNIRLQNDKTVLAKLAKLQRKGITYTNWNQVQGQVRDFQEYEQNVRSANIDPNKLNRWTKVNMGNITEGYLRKKQYGLTTFESMRRTMENPAAFWQGGDLEELGDLFGVQIKTNGASVTNVGSMITQLIKLDNQMQKIENIISNPESQYELLFNGNNDQNTQMQQSLNQSIDELVMNFLQGTMEEKQNYMQTTYGGESDWNYG